MEWLLIGGVVGVVLVVAFVRWFTRAAAQQSATAKENAPAVLDELFNGEPVVTYKAGFASLDFDEVVAGGIARGYSLAAQGQANTYGMQDLVFKRD